MPLRQRLENLPVGQKLLAALLVLLTTVLLVANLTFISAAYYISQESMAPQALQTIGRLVSSGCIRLVNEDVEDLYRRVSGDTRVSLRN